MGKKYCGMDGSKRQRRSPLLPKVIGTSRILHVLLLGGPFGLVLAALC